MDQLWMLYVEQQAQAAKSANGASSVPKPEAETSAPVPQPGPSARNLICEEPSGE
jgi:hypothetical protein